MHKSFLALATLASGLVSVPAFATPVSRVVRIGDLNLATPAGRDTLARRISHAAETVCIVRGDRSLAAMIEGKKCYDQAVVAAHRQVASVSGSIVVASK